jgi:hypothetical protein
MATRILLRQNPLIPVSGGNVSEHFYLQLCEKHAVLPDTRHYCLQSLFKPVFLSKKKTHCMICSSSHLDTFPGLIPPKLYGHYEYQGDGNQDELFDKISACSIRVIAG